MVLNPERQQKGALEKDQLLLYGQRCRVPCAQSHPAFSCCRSNAWLVAAGTEPEGTWTVSTAAKGVKSYSGVSPLESRGAVGRAWWFSAPLALLMAPTVHGSSANLGPRRERWGV